MARKKYIRDFVTVETLSKNGRTVRTAVYAGEYFEVRAENTAKLKTTFFLLSALSLSVYIAAAFQNILGDCVYVLPFFALNVVCALWLFFGAYNFLRCGKRLTRRETDKSVRRIRRAATGLSLLSGITVLSESVFLIRSGLATAGAADLFFLIFNAVLFAIGIVCLILYRALTVESVVATSAEIV